MHPILFHIPLPERPVQLLYVFLLVAALAGVIALWQFRQGRRGEAMVFGGGAGVLAIIAFRYTGETWNMGRIPIYSYGVMLGLSLVVGWYLTLTLAVREGLPKEIMANNYVVTAVAAIVGSRLLYVVTNLQEFDSLGAVFAFRKGGLVAYGGFLGGLVGSYLYLMRFRIPLLPWADVAVPSLASGLMITRMGCYLFGCDFGRILPETAPGFLKKLGTFPHWPPGTLENGEGAPAWVQHVKVHGLSPASDHSLPVHPTQLYEVCLGFSLLALLLLSRRAQKFRGQIFLLFAFSYGFARFLIEILRDDAERGSIPPALSPHILLPLGTLVFAVGFIFAVSKMIETKSIRVALQVAFGAVPVVLFIALRPEAFERLEPIQFSTSQFVGMVSAGAAAIAFQVFWKAAQEHPVAAMALNLPELPGDEAANALADEDEDEDEEAARIAEAKRREPRAKRRVKKARAGADEAPAAEEERPAEDEAPPPEADDGDAPADEAKAEPVADDEDAPAPAKPRKQESSGKKLKKKKRAVVSSAAGPSAGATSSDPAAHAADGGRASKRGDPEDEA